MFSWSNGSGTKTYPGRRLNGEASGAVEGSIRPPNSSFTRAQHLKSYVEDSTLKRSTRRVSSDDTTYDTVFQTTEGDTLILRVNMPLQSSFASFCPAMTLAGVRCKHPWVEPQRMRVTGYDPIQSEHAWNECGLLLGNAVHDVVKYFQLNPPQILEFTDRGLESVQTKTKKTTPPANDGLHNGTAQTPPRYQQQHQQQQQGSQAPPSYEIFAKQTNTPPRPNPPPDVPLPAIPQTFPTVDTMERDELDSKMGEDFAFQAYVQALPVYEELQTIRSGKAEEVKKLAEENLSKESELKELHQSVAAKQKELHEKITAFEVLEKQQNDLCQPPDKKITLKKLNKAKKEAFEKAEEYAEEWIQDGAASVDDFVKEFVELRKVHHLRGAKMEILQNSTQQI
ncbi:unnamed protein product [Cylindrotheca closterium]|uniref:VPS37 C-terminal domain-containing protein n=1 Tax=Cylindrotheca closterium TaxID=2856 RepID=A0AAD2JMN1_9STRA|nr:unnamed protein product [Cylindrotheca closterium]